MARGRFGGPCFNSYLCVTICDNFCFSVGLYLPDLLVLQAGIEPAAPGLGIHIYIHYNYLL